eukprot:gene37062-48390_t
MDDPEWAFFEPFLIAIRGRGGRPASDHCRILDAVFWIARTGSPWRDLPEEFGKWSSVYRQFRRWTLSGLWEMILDALNESGIMPDQVQMIDSTVIRAHHLAAGAKGGLKKKIHLIANAHGLPVRAEITGGEVSDFKGFDRLVDDDLPHAKVFLADRGYDSDHIRKIITNRGGTPVIPGKANRKQPVTLGSSKSLQLDCGSGVCQHDIDRDTKHISKDRVVSRFTKLAERNFLNGNSYEAL